MASDAIAHAFRVTVTSPSGTACVAEGSAFTDCSIPVRPSAKDQPGAFGLPDAKAEPFTAGSFVCAVSEGASVNCPVMHICAHSNGTHTEGAAHVLPGLRTLSEAWTPAAGAVVPAVLLTVRPRPLAESSDSYPPGKGDDAAVTSECIAEAIAACPLPAWWLGGAGPAGGAVRAPCLGAVCLRTSPNAVSKRTTRWSGTNPVYVTGEAALACRRLVAPAAAWDGASDDDASPGHLLVDLPSVDREDDGGALIAHRTFFGVDAAGGASALAAGVVRAGEAAGGAAGDHMPRRTITELCYFPDRLSDGLYALSLQCAPVELDAAPSRPIMSSLGPAE